MKSIRFAAASMTVVTALIADSNEANAETQASNYSTFYPGYACSTVLSYSPTWDADALEDMDNSCRRKVGVFYIGDGRVDPSSIYFQSCTQNVKVGVFTLHGARVTYGFTCE